MEQRRSEPVNWTWITGAWRVFTGSIITWIMMQLLVLVFVVFTISPIVFLLGGIGILLSREEWPGLAGLSVLALFSVPALLILLLVGGAFLTAGLYKAAIKRARGEEIVVTDLFSAGDSFLGVLGFFLLLMVVLGAIGSILGGIGDEGSTIGGLASLLQSIVNMVLFGVTIFALPSIVDRRAGVIEAIRESIGLTWPHWPIYALLIFVTQILSGLGVILCLVGILITAHFQWTIPAVAYCEVFGLTRGWLDDRFPTPPPPPDFRSPVVPPNPGELSPTELSSESPTLPLACPHCGASLNRISQYCSQCGTRLGADPA
ncbi:MAG: hypothetical protein ACKOB4_00155 [Acidobacteriota bacterium]